jgi:alpha-L-rhamnosidase
LRIEHFSDPRLCLGLGTPTPRLSWSVDQAPPGYTQTAYEVSVARGGEAQTAVVEGDAQVLVPWPVQPLASRESAQVRVRVAGRDTWSDWSRPVALEAGLLSAEDWQARFISGGEPQAVAPVLTRRFDIDGPVIRARLYATAQGLYTAAINGHPIGDQVLAPGWTAYQHRLAYQTYDVTALLQDGPNTIQATLGQGWYAGRIGFFNSRAHYGDRPRLLAQLEILTEDGRELVVATDGEWTASDSGVLANDLYDGQRTDLRFGTGPVADGAARPAAVSAAPLPKLVASSAPPVKVTQTLPAKKVWAAPGGGFLADFGQVAVGWVRIRCSGLEPGTEVTVRHAEVLEDGALATAPLRSARATDTYLAAGGTETLEPCFTFHGFQFAEITGLSHLEAEDVEAVVVGTDLARAGWFESSNPLLNRFHENVIWSARGNFLSVPTDCPQRDERLGWTGDIQVFAPTALFLFEAAGFLRSWLEDLALEQRPGGEVPFVVPDILGMSHPAAAAWGDAATIVPWEIYQRTGDLDVLRTQFASMTAWVDRVDALAGENHLWEGGFQYGDWLDPTAPNEDPSQAQTDPDVVATAFFARSARITADAAAVLGLDQEAARRAALAEAAREAFADAYVTPAGRVMSDSQTAYALAIAWDLAPTDRQKVAAGRRLADLVRANAYLIGTGFVGTPLVPEALAMTGNTEVAHRLVLQTGCPSWLYAVTMGATTVWERWDSMLPDGRVNGSGMTSFNHYALGAVADWLHRGVAGLAPAAPGYRRILVRPHPPAQLTHAAARHQTPYGQASVAWRREHGTFHLEVAVPVGATAEVHLPGQDAPLTVGHGHHTWTVDDAAGAAFADPPATIRELMDRPDYWGAVVEAATATGTVTGGASEVAAQLRPYLAAPAVEIAQALMPEESLSSSDAIGAALAPLTSKLSAPVSSRPPTQLQTANHERRTANYKEPV